MFAAINLRIREAAGNSFTGWWKPFLAAFFAMYLAPAAHAGLVTNGDFEAGNTGFTSEYSFAPGSNTTEGEYTVRSDPQNWNTAFAATPDHTSGTGNVLVVNGATSGNPFLWQQSVTVSPSTPYTFSAWISTAVAGGPADLTVQVNGTQLGSSFTAPAATGTWDNWLETWNSGASTLADIRIFNTDLSTFPNDFYVDDISFFVPEPSTLILAILALLSRLAHGHRRRRT